MMSFELFVLLILTGFGIGISLVVYIARSINPSVRYTGNPEMLPSGTTSGMGGWFTVLILLLLGYFLFQSKCAKDIHDRLTQSDPHLSKPEHTIENNQVAPTFDEQFSNELYLTSPNEYEEPIDTRDEISYPIDNTSANTVRDNISSEFDEIETSPEGPIYYIQVSAFSNVEMAQREREIWLKKISKVVVLGILPGEKPSKFRVLIGNFTSHEKATSFRKNHNIQGFIQSSETIQTL